MKDETLLPWRRPDPRKAELVLDVSPEIFKVRKQATNEPQPGWYVVYHNDARISNNKHEHMSAALREAEAYFYSLEKFSKSGNAKAIEAMKRIGMEDYASGLSIEHGFHQYNGAIRTNWLTGWLQSYANSAIDKMHQVAIATAKANDVLESDLRTMTARNETLIRVFEYAVTQANSLDFLSDFLSAKDDIASFKTKYPEFIVP